ncbi:hypothetical protein FE257_000563 [Aspergillus nanangensis]|uniref:Glycosyl hydrolase family 95 N-terminal domain-containing protein n=1 Tax=Aspergillus nanangensis TaxID=2582783 RepID=A0AAD4CUV2_ASPNN|nr:hypothetical protein FE257_000563 [Aspergillus nanangensis]
MAWTFSLALLLPLAAAKSLWSNSPGEYSKFITTAFPLGNGRLGAMPIGSYGKEVINLNVDSLWRGGPFEDVSYSGGNPNTSKADALPQIRQTIFQNGTGDMSALLGDAPHYGSYQVLGNLTIDLGKLDAVEGYRRQLDLQTGVYQDHFAVGETFYEREAFCSYPDQVCVYHLRTNTSLPAVHVALENKVVTSAPTVHCRGNSISLEGQTLPDIGMLYNARATVVIPGSRPPAHEFCNRATHAVHIPPGTNEVYIVLAADTNYDSTKGTAATNFSFQGNNPHQSVLATASTAAQKPYLQLKSTHIHDFQPIMDGFTLTLPDPRGSAHTPTTQLFSTYTQHPGDPFVENLLFDYGRYLFLSASRPGSLPPNLQGLWTEQASPAWSADYHANINLQMNHWAVDQVGLGAQAQPLWRYMADTWMPRGAETARLLYGAPGWVTHNEMNIFGHTAMKNDAGWANYPVVNAWMAQHIWDHFDYSRNASWYRETGYPLLKGAAQFWLSQLVRDEHFDDGTWVVNPCNSPEHGPTTFGCTNYQQQIWELFDHVLRGWPLSSDTDTTFHAAVADKFASLDRGIHIGAWGQIQEWKLDLDTPGDTHRHLSHLHGWYPGYVMHGQDDSDRVVQAVRTSLLARGDGIQDQNTGWGKMWRAACWAVLQDEAAAYELLRLAVQENFAENGLSMYAGGEGLFQIDANLGVLGVVGSMLVRDLDLDVDIEDERKKKKKKVVLGSAIPTAWAGGRVAGLRLRGGGMVGFGWDQQGEVVGCEVEVGVGVGDEAEDEAEAAPVQYEFVDRRGRPIRCR